ncbi:MAG: class I SAM-dependent methyltransferase [Sandaracinaceae bacterium]
MSRVIASSWFLLVVFGCGGAQSTDATTADTTTADTTTDAPPPAAGSELGSVPAPRERVASVEPSAAVAAAVADPARLEEDRAIDEGRQPGQVLTFFGIEPGASVADLFAGGGYTTELIARTVGPEGHVIAQNNAFVMDRFARGPLEARLARPGLENVVSVQTEFDAPLPADAHDLDAVIFILAYHDTVWMNADRDAMNRQIFDALRPGGVYGIVDHDAAEGHGVDDVQTLHRIERDVLVREVLRAGFVLDGELDALTRADDAHDWNASPRSAGERRGESDRFTLRFIRPE